ncbi:hypothetical protein Tco_1492299 [Tanacetum coccineum]
MQRLTNLEKKNHANIIKELVQANVLNEVKNHLLKFLPKSVSDYVQPRLEKIVRDVLKKNLINIHLTLYNSLMNSMDLDKSAEKGDMPSKPKRTHDDQDPKDHEREKKNKRRGDDVDEPRHDDDLVHDGHEVQTEEIPGKHNHVWFQKITEELPIQSWFNELVDAGKEPEEHEYKDGSVTQFGKLVKKFFKKDNITKEDMECLAFKLLKGTCKNSLELEYNMDQCHIALTGKIDWINPEGDKVHRDLSKSLPLTGPPVTKIKDAKYKDEGIEEIIPTLWSPNVQNYNRDAKLGIYHWYKSRQWFYKGNIVLKSRHEVYLKLNIKSVQSIIVNKKFEFAHMEEIVVTRTDEKEYKFAEADFLNLNQNDIKDRFLLKIQKKSRNIKGTEEYDLINALKMYINRIVIQKRVEDVQMGVESYQTKLNLIKPQLMKGCLHQFTPYTILSHPRGVMYKGTDFGKRLGYDNEGMEKYKWTAKDKKRTLKFMDKIDKTLKERRRF